ncbi:MAG TPA: molybdopterin dinucleotide binding domain-containing protein, partial [Acidobacteriota bacterium]
MARLYSIESTPTNTGAMADHRWAVRASEITKLVDEIAAVLSGAQSKTYPWLAPVVEDLRTHSGASVVIAGEHLPADVQAAVFALNEALGNAGQTIFYSTPVESDPQNQLRSLRQLVQDMNKGVVQSLIILGGNPVFTAPADFDFAGALSRVPFRVHLSLYQDETSFLCHWHVPETHFLESWSDAKAFDGTASIVQPLIAPLYGGKSMHEIVAAMAGHPDRSGYQLVQDYWQKQRPGPDFEHFWRKSVHEGFIEGTAFPLKSASAHMKSSPKATPPKGIELQFRSDPTIYDGRFANNGWLQELPKPLTKLTWDNVAWISPKTAQRLNVANEDLVEIKHRSNTVRAPVWIKPGQPEDSITIHFGYGRTRCGKLGNQVGFNAYSIRTSDSLWVAHDVSVRKTNQRYRLASTQQHHAMENRNLVRAATLQEYKRNPDFAKEPHQDISLYSDHEYDGYKWGMAIDLNACVGCNACVVACQAENNVPVVGKDQVSRGREM